MGQSLNDFAESRPNSQDNLGVPKIVSKKSQWTGQQVFSEIVDFVTRMESIVLGPSLSKEVKPLITKIKATLEQLYNTASKNLNRLQRQAALLLDTNYRAYEDLVETLTEHFSGEEPADAITWEHFSAYLATLEKQSAQNFSFAPTLRKAAQYSRSKSFLASFIKALAHKNGERIAEAVLGLTHLIDLNNLAAAGKIAANEIVSTIIHLNSQLQIPVAAEIFIQYASRITTPADFYKVAQYVQRKSFDPKTFNLSAVLSKVQKQSIYRETV